MIVVCEMRVCLLGGSGGMSPPPLENFEFISSQIASHTIWDKISKHFDDTYLCSVICKQLIKISGGGKLWLGGGGGNSSPPPPPPSV